jgi:hypothetical protein
MGLVCRTLADAAEWSLFYFRAYADATGLGERARAELAGRDLACSCVPDQPCHADILLAIVNRPRGRGVGPAVVA